MSWDISRRIEAAGIFAGHVMKGGGAMSSIAIIPARGGSTRRPRGYLRAFCGRPILEYSIGAALESQLFDEVVVSTEDAELAEAARACGAEVPFLRSAASSDDFEAMADMLFEVLSFYRERDQWFEMMCCIYPAAPFVTTEKRGGDAGGGHRVFLSATAKPLPVGRPPRVQ